MHLVEVTSLNNGAMFHSSMKPNFNYNKVILNRKILEFKIYLIVFKATSMNSNRNDRMMCHWNINKTDLATSPYITLIHVDFLNYLFIKWCFEITNMYI